MTEEQYEAIIENQAARIRFLLSLVVESEQYPILIEFFAYVGNNPFPEEDE